MTGDFKDHFSIQSETYAKFRPTYPAELFRFLASTVVEKDSAWDCATGNGQAAVALAAYFSNVIASDASQSQIDAAVAHPNVDYRVAAAERSGLSDDSVDLVTVGQAFHWFDESLFMSEVCRVLRPEGVLAIWCYETCQVNETCDAIIETLYSDIVGEFWPPERVMIEQGYSEADMPGQPVHAPAFTMSREWRAPDMLGYLRSWSACQRYESQNGSDPVEDIAAGLASAWGDASRHVAWPLAVKVSRPNSLLE